MRVGDREVLQPKRARPQAQQVVIERDANLEGQAILHRERTAEVHVRRPRLEVEPKVGKLVHETANEVQHLLLQAFHGSNAA